MSTILLLLQIVATGNNSAFAFSFSSFDVNNCHNIHSESSPAERRCRNTCGASQRQHRQQHRHELKLKGGVVDDDLEDDGGSIDAAAAATSNNKYVGHDYSLEANSDPRINALCRFTEEQIHVLIAKRLECKKRRNFDDSDKILKGLNLNGIYVKDKPDTNRKYRVDGQNHFGRQQRYIQRGGSYGLAPEDIPVVAELVEERARYKRLREYHRSDEITDTLKSKYSVKVNDKKREWSVVVSNWDNTNANDSSNSRGDTGNHHQEEDSSNDMYYVPSPLAPPDHATHTMSDELKETIRNRLRDRSIARAKKKYQKADQIRDELMEDYSVLIDDRTKEWKVGGDDDPFLKEAQMSQRSAFIRRQEGDEEEERRNAARNHNEFYDINNTTDDDEDDVDDDDDDDDDDNNSNTGSSSVDDALSAIFTDDADKTTTTTTMPSPPSPVIEEEESQEERSDTTTTVAAAARETGLEIETASSEHQLSALTVVALKDRLRTAGLPVSGKKAELIDRLLSASIIS